MISRMEKIIKKKLNNIWWNEIVVISLWKQKRKYMDYKIVTSSNSHTLTENIRLLIGEGWEPVGSHQVVTIHDQNRYRGTQHIDTTHETEYSQTLIKRN
jgi:hypothetical protein